LPEVDVASVAAVLREATSALAPFSQSPRLDAELLLAEALGVDRSRLVLDARRALEPGALDRFRGLVGRRAAHEPVAYILGRKEFRRITLRVDARVLIPRPETELLVEVGLTLPFGASVVDVGTGSGAVALALKSERPDLCVWGVDVDPDALFVARENGVRLGIDVRFLEADLLDSPRLPARLDAVLANLPYVASGSSLPPDVAQYEPAGALFAGSDGLDVIRRLVAQVSGVDLIALEVGFDQAQAVAALLAPDAASHRAPRAASHSAPRAAPSLSRTNSIEIVRDLAGHERVVVRRR
jgi:release factor glutamine methyltransferase